MASRQWLDRLETELRRRSLPAGYRARLLEELADHLSELERETTSMEAQLLLEERIGTPEAVAVEARSEYLARTFAGRHPVLTFGLIPVLTVVVAIIATMFALGGAIWLTETLMPEFFEPPESPTMLHWVAIYGAVSFVRLAPFVPVAILFARAGRRIHQPRWGLIGCAIVAAMALLFWTQVDTEPDSFHGRLYIGFGAFFRGDQLLQAALPLGIGLWALVRREKRTMALSA
jgi:hypothetical protein